MLYKNLILVSFLALAGLTLSSCKTSIPSQNNQTIESNDDQVAGFTASFAVFTDNTFRVFTASMYHNRNNDVFITSENPNVVTVKRSNITWGDFFNSLPMKLTNECLTTGTGEEFCTNQTKTLKFFINGERIENFIDAEIESNDRALISYGAQTQEQIQNQLKQIPII